MKYHTDLHSKHILVGDQKVNTFVNNTSFSLYNIKMYISPETICEEKNHLGHQLCSSVTFLRHILIRRLYGRSWSYLLLLRGWSFCRGPDVRAPEKEGKYYKTIVYCIQLYINSLHVIIWLKWSNYISCGILKNTSNLKRQM